MKVAGLPKVSCCIDTQESFVMSFLLFLSSSVSVQFLAQVSLGEGYRNVANIKIVSTHEIVQECWIPTVLAG